MRVDLPLRWLSGVLLVLGLLFAACNGERSNEDPRPAPPLPSVEGQGRPPSIIPAPTTAPEGSNHDSTVSAPQKPSDTKDPVTPVSPASATEEVDARRAQGRLSGQVPAAKTTKSQGAKRPNGTSRDEPDMFDLLTGQGEGEEPMKRVLEVGAGDPKAAEVYPGPQRRKE